MALDRAWYNALIDDDGSNTVGTVWGKDDIKNLLDSVDAELLRFDNQMPAGSFTPVLQGGGGGVPTYGSRMGLYARAGKLAFVSGNIAITSKGSLAGAIQIAALPLFSSAAGQQGGFMIGYFNGLATAVASINGYLNPSANAVGLTWVAAAGGTTSNILDTAHIGATFNCIFSGAYRID